MSTYSARMRLAHYGIANALFYMAGDQQNLVAWIPVDWFGRFSHLTFLQVLMFYIHLW